MNPIGKPLVSTLLASRTSTVAGCMDTIARFCDWFLQNNLATVIPQLETEWPGQLIFCARKRTRQFSSCDGTKQGLFINRIKNRDAGHCIHTPRDSPVSNLHAVEVRKSV